MSKPRILIAGAGLGGLTAAIALAQRGFAVTVCEQADALREVGAGLTVSPAAERVLAALGLHDQVRARASYTRNMVFAHYRTGRILSGIPDHGDGTQPGGGIHIHRAEMHELLAGKLEQVAPGSLQLDHRLVDIAEGAEGEPVVATFANGNRIEADLLVGADGIRSILRARLWGDGTPEFTGQVAFRFMLPAEVAAPYLGELGRAAVYQGPGRVFNRYTLRKGTLVNCVGITQSDAWNIEGWSQPAERAEMLALYHDWHPDVVALMERADERQLIKWGLFARAPLPRWQRGRVTLLGDAAHPMLPFLGLGAAMAIEDGMVLARALEQSPDARGLAVYEANRHVRTGRIADLSRRQGELFQQRDPDAYDPAQAPAHDPSLQDYDPVTVPLTEPVGA